LTSSQSLRHFFRQVKGRLHTTQIFSGKFSFLYANNRDVINEWNLFVEQNGNNNDNHDADDADAQDSGRIDDDGDSNDSNNDGHDNKLL